MAVSTLPESPDMLVIGLGTTGKAALDAARATGAKAIGVDRGPGPDDDTSGCCIHDTCAWGIFSDGTVVLALASEQSRCRPRAIIVATGSLGLPLPIPGWELEGVTGAHRASERLPAGSRVVVLRGPHARLGTREPDLSGFDVLADYGLAGDPPVAISGMERVESITIGDERLTPDFVLLDNGIQPENVLARMTGLPTTFSTPAGGDVIVPGTVIAADSSLLSVVGDASGIHTDREETIREAEETGRTLAESLLDGRIPVSTLSHRRSWPTRRAPILPSQITDETLVCPAEGVTVTMVHEAIANGATTVNDVKRRTRAAMASCQGRDCLWTIRAMLAEAGRDWETPMTARPPAVGITLQELAAIGAD